MQDLRLASWSFWASELSGSSPYCDGGQGVDIVAEGVWRRGEVRGGRVRVARLKLPDWGCVSFQGRRTNSFVAKNRANAAVGLYVQHRTRVQW
jgi:hypothetical protein